MSRTGSGVGRDEGELDRVVASVRTMLDGPCAVPRGTPLVVACSGGADSVALVEALGRCEGWPLAAVAFAEHGLHDAGPEREAAERAARRHGVPFERREAALPSSGNRQAEARRARYRVLHEVAAGYGEAVLATAHTRTDQAETVVQRLLRGAGLAGLAGIPPREGRVVRPLLEVTRATTRALGLPCADDPTNDSDAYQRNRIRRHVLPTLAGESPEVEAMLASVARQASAEWALVEALLQRLPDPGALDLRGWSEDVAAAWVHWRRRREAPDHPTPSRGAVRELARRLVAGEDGGVSLGGGLYGRAERGGLRLEVEDDPRHVLVAPAPGTYGWGRWVLAARPDEGAAVTERGPTDGERGCRSPSSSSAGTVAAFRLDARRVRWPLRLRVPTERRRRAAPAGGAEPDLSLRDGRGRELWSHGRGISTEARPTDGPGLTVRVERRPDVGSRAEGALD